ncbi:Gamma-glutamyltranspeptidase 1 [Harpegnathos saltator]|uniref:Gamma-glutamyltranspeptidase 1 n=1 Tax=Harpegnathos saltator TaxID=610380 RepID=E2BEE3_HARSA|nr:Gamma-glutamyltranspeptidase 1 [Harpegnathos saltator]
MLVLQILYTEDIPQSRLHGIHGAVATDYSNCSQIGTRILRRLGNAVDAAVAATICMTVVAPHKTGLGGGGYIMIHNFKNQSYPIIIDFASNTTGGIFAKAGIRLPALLRGLELAQRSYGILPWRDIVKPSANLAREGFVVSKDFVDEVLKNTDYGALYGPLNPGDTLSLQELASTLDIIAEYGTKELYNGTLSYKILHDDILHDDILHGNLLQQLANYEPTVIAVKNSTLHHHTVYYSSHASFMQSVIETLENLPIFAENASTIDSQALIAQTLTHLHLLFSQNTQHGSPLGLRNMTAAGFLLDKNVDDNDLSIFIPIIFHHEKERCGLRGVFGSDDAFLNGQILYNLVVRVLNVSAAIEYPRYYYVSDGMVIENNQRHSMETALRIRLQPMISSLPTDDNSLIKSVNAIIKRKDALSSHSDSRGNGISSRF